MLADGIVRAQSNCESSNYLTDLLERRQKNATTSHLTLKTATSLEVASVFAPDWFMIVGKKLFRGIWLNQTKAVRNVIRAFAAILSSKSYKKALKTLGKV